MIQSIKLEPQDLREVWDTIKPGLEAIKAAWPELSTWLVEDVYASIKAKESVVYVTEDGFAVCNVITDQYSGLSDLFIWIAYSFQPGGNMIEKYLPSFIEVARDLGYRGVVTQSNHPALAKVEQLEPVYTEYMVLVDV
jgi:hypothetical protein